MHKKTIRYFLLIILFSLIFSLPAQAIPTGSGTYNPSAAASYADSHVTSGNPYYPWWDQDCTNFVSQSLRAGGWPWANFGISVSSPYAWYYNDDSSPGWFLDDTWAYNWSTARMLFTFIVLNSNPSRGSRVSTYPGTTSVAYPSGTSIGDPVFYDFDGDTVIDHASIYVANGQDVGWPPFYQGSYYTGALVDAHSSTRVRAIWSLSFYNPERYNTVIYTTHLKTSF